MKVLEQITDKFFSNVRVGKVKVAQLCPPLCNPMDYTVRGILQARILEKEMGVHSSVLAWRIPWTEGPGGLQSMGLQRVGHE